MTDDNQSGDEINGFGKLDDIDLDTGADTDGDVNKPTEAEIENMTLQELREEYGPYADLLGVDDGEDHREQSD